MKKTILSIMIMSLVFGMFACNQEDYTYNYGEKEMVDYIWNSNIIYNESVVFVEKDGVISASLLYKPTEIISVRDYTLNNIFSSDQYDVEEEKLVASTNTTMPYLSEENVFGKNLPEGYAFSTYDALPPHNHILFTEGTGIVMHTVFVTYRHEDEWQGPMQESQSQYLKPFIERLNNQKQTNIVLYGDSISTGANASSILGIAPFQSPFGELFVNYLRRQYHEDIELINTSKGGMTSEWGKENIDIHVNQYHPDLAIIAFGMNDGSWEISAHEYKQNIEFMIRSIQARNNEASILLVATTLPNPDSIQNKNQKNYLDVLNELSYQYDVGVVDMTSMSEYLLTQKRAIDLYANHINHPNDFLTRVYAMSLIEAVTEG